MTPHQELLNILVLHKRLFNCLLIDDATHSPCHKELCCQPLVHWPPPSPAPVPTPLTVAEPVPPVTQPVGVPVAVPLPEPEPSPAPVPSPKPVPVRQGTCSA